MSDVRDFGATGNGETDDTAAIEHALQAGEGVLRFSKGMYRITRPLVMDLTRQGYGAVLGDGGTARIVMAGAGPALRIIGDHRGTALPSTVQPHTWEKERFPCVGAVEIVGAHPEAVGIELHKTMQCTISNVLVRNCKHGIHLVERNRNFLLADSHIYDNAEYGLFLDNCNLHQINVIGNHISYNHKAGIKSLNGDVHNFQITGNDIEYNNNPGVDESPNGEPTGAEIWFESPDGRISEVTIASNTIQATVEPGGANIRIHGVDQDPALGAILIAITGNVIGSQRRGIELKHAQRVAINGNTIYGNEELSLFASNCSGISLGPNTLVWQGREDDPPRDGILLEDCSNSAITGLVTQRLCYGTPESGAGITLVRCSDSAVSECQVTDPLVRGIELEDCLRCRISNNSIVDRRQTPSMRQAIRVRGQSSHNLIANNLVAGAIERLIDVPAKAAEVRDNLEA